MPTEVMIFNFMSSPWKLFCLSILPGVAALLLGYEALQNNKGVIINGIIHLGVQGATILYWSLSICIATYSISLLLQIISRF